MIIVLQKKKKYENTVEIKKTDIDLSIQGQLIVFSIKYHCQITVNYVYVPFKYF